MPHNPVWFGTMKRVPYMTNSWQFERTQAFQISSAPGVEKSRVMLRLMHHALQAAKTSPTCEKNKLTDIKNADFHAELKTNPELHAALDCLRYMLQDVVKDPVQPFGQVQAKDGTYWTPLQKAAAIEKEFPQLGEYMTRKLTTHANTLIFKENNPDVWEQAYHDKIRAAARKKTAPPSNKRNGMSQWDQFLAI